MRIVLAGGSGQVGTLLARAFRRDGHEVVILSRGQSRPSDQIVHWDGRTLSAWTLEIDRADVVINLAGRSVNCRYNPRNQREILESRVESTQILVQAIASSPRPPRLWLQASTATIYAHRYDAPNDEITGATGGENVGAPSTWNFSLKVAQAWEAAALPPRPLPHTRTVLLRSAMVMSPDAGGVFDVLLGLVRTGLGGQAGDGRQFVSWIHEHDFVRAIYWLIAHDAIAGPVNLCSPHPLPNAEFMRDLRRAWGSPVGLPASRWMLEIGAWMLRTETELILKSRRVVPTRLLQSGFEFQYPTWREAAQELCARWRGSSGGLVPSLAKRKFTPPRTARSFHAAFTT